jgi:HlyD family secretion protein
MSVKSLKSDSSAIPKSGAAVSAQPDESRMLGGRISKRTGYLIAAAVLAAGGLAAWLIFSGSSLPHGFAAGNGRLEANQVYVATKYPGRILEVLFNEGDTVDAGQVVARMDTSSLEAQLRQALSM